MNTFFSYANLPLLVTGFFVLVIVLVALFLAYRIKATRDKERYFYEQIQNANKDNAMTVINGETQKHPLDFLKNFANRLRQAELADELASDAAILTKLGVFIALIYLVALIIFKSPFIGIVPIVFIIAVLSIICSAKIAGKRTKLEDQIPGFLSSLKSNIQANTSPENALASAIENTNEPLYDELKVGKALIETGSFPAALRAMRMRTTNDSLKFLCSSVELAVDVGAPLEEQITIIQDIFNANKEIERKLQGAIAENKPLNYVTAILVPGLFMVMYMTSDQVRSFWFVQPISWALLVAIIVLLALGWFLTSKLIASISK